MSLVYSGVEPQPSLAWQFESSNVDSVTGLAPSSQVSPGPAQLVGSAALVSNAPTSNTAVYFPGVSGSYMNLGTSSPTNFNHSTSNIFVEAWVNIVSLSTNPMIYERYTAANFTDFNFSLNSFGVLSLIMKDGTTGLNYTSSNAFTASTGTWYHVAFSYEIVNKNATVFVNGFPGTAVTLPNAPKYTSTTPIMIGGMDSQNNHNLYIRDLRVVQGGIVPTTSFTPSTAPFSYTLPSYVTGSGSVVFTLLGQFVTYPSGKYGLGLSSINSLSSVTSYLKYIPTTPITESNGFSISCWVNFLQLPNSGGRMAWVNLSNGTGYGQGVWLSYDRYGSGTFSLYYENTGVGFATPSYNLTATTGVWYHVCGTIGKGSADVYLNGVKGTTVSYSTTGTSYSNIYVCCHVNGAPTPYIVATEMFSGTIDDLRIYNTALTAAQVQSVYSSQGAPAPSRAMPLPQLAWDFNGTTTDYISGLVAQSPTQLQGFSTIMVSNAPTSNIAAYFPGNTTFQLTAQGPLNNLNLVTTNVFAESLVYMNSLTPTKSTVLSRGQLATSTDWWMGVSSSGTFQASVSNTSGVSFTASTVANLTTGSWNHVAFSYVSSTKTLYTWLNGASQGTALLTGTANTYTSFRTYMGGDGGSQLANMYVRDVRVVSGSVVPTSATFTPAAAPWGLAQASYVSNMGTSIYAFPSQTINYSNGKYNQAIVLKNPLNQTAHPNNYVIWTLSPVLGSTTTSYGYSITFWFNPSATNSWTQHMVELAGLNGDGDLRLSILNNKSRVEYNINTSASARTFQGVSSSNNYIVNGWNHFAITLYESVSGTSLCFYLNNVLEGTLTSAWGTLRTFPRLAAGNYPTGQTYPFGYDGLLDDLRIYNTALTAAQVRSIYNQQGVPGRAVQVRAVQPLLVGNATILYGLAPTGNTAAYFPGTVNDYINLGTSTPTNFDASTSNVFFEAWINWTDFGGNRIYGRYLNPQATSSLNLYLRLNNGLLQLSGGTGSTSGNSTTFTAGVWYHIAFSSIPGGSSYVFVNGVPGTGTSLTYTAHNATYNTYIGSGASQYLSGYIRDLRVVQGGVAPTTAFTPGSAPWAYGSVPSYVITGTNVLGLAAQYMSPMPMSGTPLFTQLSPSATSSAVGAFSLRAVNGTVAKAVQVRNGTTSAIQDFYADRLGNLLTAPVTGQTLANWLGTATGYVTTWYDQSGAGNHMSCSSVANQPKIDLVNKFIDLKPSAYFDVSAGTSGPVPFQSTKNYTVVFRHGQFIGSGLFCATQNSAGPYGNLVNNFKKGTGATYTQYWYGNDVVNKGVLATGNRVSYKWDGTNRSLYVNGTLADATPSSGWAQTSAAIQMIGKTNFDATMNGELYGAFMFTTALSDADRILLENFL